jgi:hypothetical protein
MVGIGNIGRRTGMATPDLDINLQLDSLTLLPVIVGFMQAVHDELAGCRFTNVNCIDGQDCDDIFRFTATRVAVRAVAPWVRARRGYPRTV